MQETTLSWRQSPPFFSFAPLVDHIGPGHTMGTQQVQNRGCHLRVPKGKDVAEHLASLQLTDLPCLCFPSAGVKAQIFIHSFGSFIHSFIIHSFGWLVFCFVFFKDKVFSVPWLSSKSLCRPGWPRTTRDPPASASRIKGVHHTMPILFLKIMYVAICALS